MSIISIIRELKEKVDDTFRDLVIKDVRRHAESLQLDDKISLIEDEQKMWRDFSFSRAVMEPGYILKNFPYTREDIGAKKFVFCYCINTLTEGVKLAMYLYPSYLIYQTIKN